MGGGAMMESLGFIALCLAGGLILWNRWQTKHTMQNNTFQMVKIFSVGIRLEHPPEQADG